MNLLFNVIYATHTRSTHHKLALHSLLELKGASAQRWRNLFLKHHQQFLRGAKDPDTKFKDFCNHVLHVEQDNWGGAPETARRWYGELVEALRRRKWPEAVYAAGVLSHYYTDPIMPFHTGQSVEETNIHRATEWSIAKAYEELREIHEESNREVRVRVPRESDWLEQMVVRGAQRSHRHYQELIDHYDIHSGTIDPPSGLDGHSMRFLADLLAYATVGFARILERAFDEAKAKPPQVQLSVETFLATVEVPIRWVTRKMADATERKQIEAMYEELLDTGKVELTLPDESRAVRAHLASEAAGGQQRKERAQRKAEEIAERAGVSSLSEQDPVDDLDDEETTEPTAAEPKTSLFSRLPSMSLPSMSMPSMPSFFKRKPAEQTSQEEAPDDVADESANLRLHEHDDEPPAVSEATAFEQPEATEPELRYYLKQTDNVVDAPSIGAKTAKRLARVGIRTVTDLLTADAAETAESLNTNWITSTLVNDWQHQAYLVCTVPNLRGHDAQILVACGYRSAEEITAVGVAQLQAQAEAFCQTKEGERVIRSGKLPDYEEVGNWIDWAGIANRANAA